MLQGSHTLRLTLTQGGRTRLDYVGLYPAQACAGVPDVPMTWGRIKTLWR